MLTLLNLLSAVALLIWGTHIVRTGILRVYGTNLRHVIGQNMSKKWLAFIAGILVTAMVQSSNATAMLVTSFVGQGLMALTPALATMLGADVGTALMARVLTLDLSWLSPLLIFLGVIFFLSRKQTRLGQMGRVSIGLGLIILALQLIVEAAAPITHAQGVKVIFASLTGDILLDALVGALFAMISYSSLAAVLLTATLAGAAVISLPVAIGLVIGFHLLYNTARCLILLPSVGPMARLCGWLLPERPEVNGAAKPRHLDPTALVTPSLALANAARETLRMGDLLDNMLDASLDVLRGKQTAVTQEMRRLTDDVEALYSAIKLYLAQMPREDLGEHDSRRWAEIIELAINLKLAADLIERMLRKIQQQKTSQRRSFSEEGLEDLAGLQQQLIANLRLGLSVFLSGDRESARQLLREKRRFRAQERRLAHAHVSRLQRKIVQSLETSSLHLELIADMKRLNSLFCSSAYVVLETADTGALAVDDMADITHSP
jgi:phosphate:Na+ symporter